ncbi:phosphotransferase family protein [Blastococcus sp. TF02A-26]|uniref:phosphotransferase family protein n=1 Tax=Blastococcus sp. TF02A-26 TaxID=2250577 RepID=UPI000DEA2B5A|nr:phosphotransferase [Blastococcus sp. TF02A-26]RBY86175.1 aminoglycoside phosphotransferase [Blastococcus sp. TF02A-26]
MTAAAAVAAARAVAADAGVPSPTPRVLADGVNVVVHLAPAPVVARVATRTTELRPDATVPFGREVALAGALAAAGAAVVRPSAVVPPGPHVRDGLVLSFWQHVEVLPDRPGPREAATALAELHEHLVRVLPAGEPLDRPLLDLAAFAADGARWGATPAQCRRLGERLATLRPRLAGEVVALHGDAHPGNLLATPGGWRWTDLEDTCPGPREWDLACLRLTSRLDGRAALDGLPGSPSDAELAPWLELRRMHAAAWTAVLAASRPAHRAAAVERLTAEFG